MPHFSKPTSSLLLGKSTGECPNSSGKKQYIDYEQLVAKAKLVLDTRNATRHVKNYRERITLL